MLRNKIFRKVSKNIISKTSFILTVILIVLLFSEHPTGFRIINGLNILLPVILLILLIHSIIAESLRKKNNTRLFCKKINTLILSAMSILVFNTIIMNVGQENRFQLNKNIFFIGNNEFSDVNALLVRSANFNSNPYTAAVTINHRQSQSGLDLAYRYSVSNILTIKSNYLSGLILMDNLIFWIQFSLLVILLFAAVYFYKKKKKIEHAFNENDEQYNSAIDQQERLIKVQEIAQIGFLEWNIETNEIYCSKELYQLHCLDKSKNPLTLEDISKAIHPDDVDFVLKNLDMAVNEEKGFDIEHRLLTPNGKIIWVHAQAELRRGKDSTPKTLFGTVQDITERKTADEKLIKANRTLAWVRNLHTTIIRITERELLYEEVCRIAVEKGGFKIAWIGMKTGTNNDLLLKAISGSCDNYLDISNFGSGETDHSLQMALKTLNTGKYEIINNIFEDANIISWQEYALNFEFQSAAAFPLIVFGKTSGVILLYSDEKHFFDESEAKLLNELSKNISFAIEFIETEKNRKDSEKQKSELLDRFEKISQQVPGVIYQFYLRKDGSSCFPYASDGIKDIYGVTPDDVKNDSSPLFNVLHPDDLDSLIKSIEESAEKLSIWHNEHRVNLPSGKTIWVEGNSIPERMEDGSTLWHGYINDITERKRTEELIFESEARYRALVDNSPMGIIVHTEVEPLYANLAARKMFGISADDDIGYIKVFNYIIPLHKKEARKQLNKIKETGQANPLIKVGFKSIDGRQIYLEITSMPLIYKGKKVFQTLFNDVTEKNEAQRRLKENRRRFQLALKATSEVIWDLDFNTNLIEWNENFTKLFGWEMDELEPTLDSLHQRLHPEDIERVSVSFSKAVESGLDFWNDEYRFLKKDGSYSYVLDRAYIIYDDKNIAIRAIGSMQDISDIKKREAEIRHLNSELEILVDQRTEQLAETNIKLQKEVEERKAANKRITMIIESSPNGIILIDSNGLIQLVNKQIEKYFGYNRSELVGENIEKLIPQHINTYLTNFDLKNPFQPIVHKMGINGNSLGLRNDGTKIPIEVGVNRITIDEESMVLTTIIDITERKKIEDEIRDSKEKAEKANKAKSEFLSRMSHELRTPMNSILGFAQLLEMGKLNPSQLKGVQQIKTSGQHLLSLINEVLDISKIEAGKLSISIESILIGNIISEVLDSVQIISSERKVKLTFDDSPDNSLHVKADRQRLKQILLNLINNAIKYNKEGGTVNIFCEKSMMDSEISSVIVKVIDSGQGIPPNAIGKLFEPFERAGVQDTDVEGTGLGLAVVKKLIDAMNGEIGVSSKQNEGSTFWIELPIIENKKVEGIENYTTDNSKIDKTSALHTIIYVDDSSESAILIDEILCSRRPGNKIIKAQNFENVLDASKENNPDFIIIDLSISIQKANQIINKLKSNNITVDIPLILLYAELTSAENKEFESLGVNFFVKKPIEISTFLNIIDNNGNANDS